MYSTKNWKFFLLNVVAKVYFEFKLSQSQHWLLYFLSTIIHLCTDRQTDRHVLIHILKRKKKESLLKRITCKKKVKVRPKENPAGGSIEWNGLQEGSDNFNNQEVVIIWSINPPNERIQSIFLMIGFKVDSEGISFQSMESQNKYTNINL